MSKFLSGGLDPFWPHVSLLSISVLASIAVGAGIIFERPKYSAAVHRVAFWLIVAGVAIEAMCTIFLFVFDEGISQSQQERIASLDQQLLQIRFPRSLNFERFKAELAGVTPQSFEVLYDPGVPDGENLAILISASLGQIGWRTTQPMAMALTPQKGPPGLEGVWHALPLSQQAGGGPWGVSVVTNAPSLESPKMPADVLTTALSDALIGPPSMTIRGRDVTMPPNVIRVVVGSKLP